MIEYTLSAFYHANYSTLKTKKWQLRACFGCQTGFSRRARSILGVLPGLQEGSESLFSSSDGLRKDCEGVFGGRAERLAA